MDKLLFSFIILVLSLQMIIAQEEHSKEIALLFMLTNRPSEYLIIQGKVRSIEPETSSLEKIKGRWIKGGKYQNPIINYSPDKSIIEVVLYGDNGNVFRKEVYSIDSNHKLTSWDLYEADGRHSGTKTIYNYNKEGQITEAINYVLGNFNYKETFSYLDKYRIEVRRQFEPHSNEIDKEIYIFNMAGKIKEIIFMDKGVKHKATYKYDSKGYPISYSFYNKSGTLIEKETYSYELDKNGNWIKTKATEYEADKAKPKPKSIRIITRKIIYY